MDKEHIDTEGWNLSTTTSGQHLKRTLEMYRELGFDVLIKEVTPEDCGECTACYVAGKETLYRVYTRPKDETGELESI